MVSTSRIMMMMISRRSLRQGRVFDDATIDDALKILGQVSGKLPASMQGVGPAGATVLESLRGRTLEDGAEGGQQDNSAAFPSAPKIERGG
jgi:hypothetical protein